MKLPAAFIEKYQTLLQASAPAFFESYDQPVQAGFRLNPLKENYQAVQFDLSRPIPYTKWGYYGQIDGKTVDHQAGYVYSQEPSAMFVGEVVAPKPGERVLDLCAAPGGKTTHLASFMNQSGLLVSNEINNKRAKILAENVQRFGLQNTVVINTSPDQLAPQVPEFFDKILVDAPCSGEGMFHKDPAAMDYWHADYPAECANRQQHILQSAYDMLKPGGQLVYSTCTFSPEEDEQTIAWLLATYPDMTLLPIEKTDGIVDGRPDWADGNPELTKTARLWPHLVHGEGHFVAKLQKAGVTTEKTGKWQSFNGQDLNASQKTLWAEFMAATFTQPVLAKQRLITHAERLYAIPVETPDLGRTHLQQAGVLLGEFKKNRFEPSYALILALKTSQLKQVIALTTADYQHYCHGETIQVEMGATGWVGLTYQGKLFSFGKQVQTTIKNFYPKRLRY